jgi:hypothetical protein
MKNLIATAAVVGFLMTGTAYAAQTTLSDQQMDTVTAGFAMKDNIMAVTQTDTVTAGFVLKDNIAWITMRDDIAPAAHSVSP